VISHPNDKKPARPIETEEHERSAEDRENPDHRDKAKFNGTLGNTPRSVHIHQRQEAGNQCDAADGYEDPTDGRDGAWTFVHPTSPR